jgi:hypothetical protein
MVVFVDATPIMPHRRRTAVRPIFENKAFARIFQIDSARQQACAVQRPGSTWMVSTTPECGLCPVK